MAKFSKAKLGEIWAVNGGAGKNRMKDAFGKEIDKAAYGDTNSEYGWDVDHIVRLRDGGSNETGNLRPLHIKNNRLRN